MSLNTQSSLSRPPSPHSSSPSDTSPTSTGQKRKRTLFDYVSINVPPAKRVEPLKRIPKTLTAAKSKSLVQLHFVVDSTLYTCPSCSFSYVKGAVDDEMLHRKHCVRVQRGLEWGKEEEKEVQKANVRTIEDMIRVKGSTGGAFGRIIAVPMGAGGKIGAKLASLLETISLVLSSPALPPDVITRSKAYLFLVPSKSGRRESIIGCVIAQRIASAMNVVHVTDKEHENNLLHVDGGLYCSPQLFPTTMGVSRIFVPAGHRRQGIATLLLNAAAKTFVHGCELDPTRGEVAFSQPTGNGRNLMSCWGKGGVRIFQE